MKKLRILLILCLTLAVTLPAASANSWNLSGQLLAMVEQTHDYDEYTGLVSDYNRKAATTHTILTSRYHNQLVAVDEVKDGWKDAIFSTTAVYQPSELDETGYPKDPPHNCAQTIHIIPATQISRKSAIQAHYLHTK